MSWCCVNVQQSETDAVEINLRSTLDATEAWLEMCKAKRAHNGRQRRANEARRMKLEQDRSALIDDKEKAQEALQRIQADIQAIDLVIAKLEDAETEIERLDHELELEELDMKAKEESIQEHLCLISNLAVTGTGGNVGGTTNQGVTLATENIFNNSVTPISNRNLKSLKSPKLMLSTTPSTLNSTTSVSAATRLPYLLQPQQRLSLTRTNSNITVGESPIAPTPAGSATANSAPTATNGASTASLPKLPAIRA